MLCSTKTSHTLINDLSADDRDVVAETERKFSSSNLKVLVVSGGEGSGR